MSDAAESTEKLPPKDERVSRVPPINIKLTEGPLGPHKSIGSIEWNDVPPFVVLTGLNGSGKTQLLQAIALRVAGFGHREFESLNSMGLTITGAALEPCDLAYLPNSEGSFSVPTTNISQISQAKIQYLNQLQPQSTVHNMELEIQRLLLEKRYGIRVTNGHPTAEMLAKLPDDFQFMLQNNDVSTGLAHVCFNYKVRFADQLLDGKPEAEVRKALGAPPWELVNDALASAEFPYRLTPPRNKLLSDYTPTLTSDRTQKPILFNDLSSGERAILRTLLWFYNSKHNGLFPKLILMDEPDAHLHPSMTRQFLTVLKDVMVDQFGVRVILTTHSPSTVALAPDDSIFVMSRDEPRVKPAASKSAAIAMLTAGLVTVSPGSRFILVEDEADVRFYNAVRDILTDQGPSKDQRSLPPIPSLIFLPASMGKKADRISGGSSVVEKLVGKFDAPPLSEMIKGVVDLDDGAAQTSRVLTIGRYSIENYLTDPLIVYAALNDEGVAPLISGLAVSRGDEHLLRSLENSALQTIVDSIVSVIAPQLPEMTATDKLLVDVNFTNGLSLKYPNWVLTRKGHDLLSAYQKAFGQILVTPPRLEKAFRRVRLVPEELAILLARLQT